MRGRAALLGSLTSHSARWAPVEQRLLNRSESLLPVQEKNLDAPDDSEPCEAKVGFSKRRKHHPHCGQDRGPQLSKVAVQVASLDASSLRYEQPGQCRAL